MSLQVQETQTSGEITQAGANEGAQGGAAGDNPGGAPASTAKEGEPSPGAAAAAASTEDPEKPEGDAPAAPQFTPKGKFKVRQFDPAKLDELIQKEVDVPELFKALMKDEKTEKEVLDILERAYGIDAIKGERAHVKKELTEVRNQLGSMKEGVQELRAMYQRGDLDLFFDKLAIPHERVLQWALDRVNYSQLPPEQQRIFDERRDAQRQAYEAEKRASLTQTQSSEQIRHATSLLLDAGLARPETQSVAEIYDARVGRPGAFRDEVIATANQAWNESNGQVVLTPDQAIEKTLAKWKPFLANAQASAAPQAAGQQAQPGGTQPPASTKPAATIPNVQGRPQSPMKSAPRSIEDLKKLRDRAASSG
jgi:hypothetical protein